MYTIDYNSSKMNIFELSKLVAKETGEPAYRINKILCITVRIIRREILRAQIIKLTNLLTIFVDVVEERNYFHVKNNRVEKTPRRFILKIIPSKKLKKEVNAKRTY